MPVFMDIATSRMLLRAFTIPLNHARDQGNVRPAFIRKQKIHAFLLTVRDWEKTIPDEYTLPLAAMISVFMDQRPWRGEITPAAMLPVGISSAVPANLNDAPPEDAHRSGTAIVSCLGRSSVTGGSRRCSSQVR
jgi:hypothetical protein